MTSQQIPTKEDRERINTIILEEDRTDILSILHDPHPVKDGATKLHSRTVIKVKRRCRVSQLEQPR